jgi:hypothetical protein
MQNRKITADSPASRTPQRAAHYCQYFFAKYVARLTAQDNGEI